MTLKLKLVTLNSTANLELPTTLRNSISQRLNDAIDLRHRDTRLDHLINIYSYAGQSPIIVVNAATVVSGEMAVDDEGLEIREFGLDEIPWDDLAFRSTREALRDYLDGRRVAPA